jgi:hypothetical protein
LTRYLIGGDPDAREVALFARAIQQAPLVTPRDQRLWRWMMARPWLLPWLDAGLARLDPAAPARHRILLMLAILEASPRHTAQFLPRRFGWGGVAAMGAGAVLGAVRVVGGVVLLRCAGLR